MELFTVLSDLFEIFSFLLKKIFCEIFIKVGKLKNKY
ncbi:hypothetical protein SAMN05444146_0049 [Flavobacterium johnsoniae]|nr:hypothetical protein SAMN05444146_0049 [Flavobacterium johnsoniae]